MYLCVSYRSQYTAIISLCNITLLFFVMENHCENFKVKIKIFKYYLDKVADIAGGKEAEGVWEHGVEENIWT